MNQFPLFPRFTDGSTALCPYNEETPQLFHRWFSDNDLITRMGDWEFYPLPYSDHSAIDYAKRTRKTTWLICAMEPSGIKPIGYTGIYVKPRHRTGIFRIAIPEMAYRKQGHGYRATCMFIKWAFTQLDLFALHLSVTSSNDAAIALYSKCSFRKCGRYALVRYEPDGRYDEIHMELLRTEWEYVLNKST